MILLDFECYVHVSGGFLKKFGWGEWVGGVSSIQAYLDFFLNFFNFTKPLNRFIRLLLFLQSRNQPIIAQQHMRYTCHLSD